VNDAWSYSSHDYSTDEEYLNTIAGFDGDSDDEEEKGMKTFNLIDTDDSDEISMKEFLEYSRNRSSNRETMDESLKNNCSPAAKRLQVLKKKVEENSKKLDRICEILEAMKLSQR